MPAINNVISTLKKYQKQLSDSPAQSERLRIVTELIKLIENAKRLKTLEQVITTIEQIKFKDFSKEFTIYQALKAQGKPCMLNVQNQNPMLIQQKEVMKKAFASKIFITSLHFDQVLIETHQKLYELCAKEKTQKQYTNEDIDQSNQFNALKLTTAQQGAKDVDAITIDLTRGRVGRVALDGCERPEDKETAANDLEKFTHDKITDSSSKANKLYYYGGQFLYTALIKEIVSSLEIQLKDGTSISGNQINPGYTMGEILWKKDSSGSIYAEVNLSMLNLSYNDDNNGNIMMLALDPNADWNFQEISNLDDEYGPTMKILKAEREGDTKGAIMPLITTKARIELIEENGAYCLAVVQNQMTYHAKEVKKQAVVPENNNNNNQCRM